MSSFEVMAYDVDGTLADSLPKHAEAEVLAAQEMGVQTDLFDWSDFKGKQRKQVWQILAPDQRQQLQEFDDLADQKFNQITDDPHNPLRSIAGAGEFLAYARRHLPLAAQVTNSVRTNLDAMNAHFEWSDFFDMTIAYQEAGRGKPWPDPYLAVGERLNVENNRIIAVEDSLTGITAAKYAGVFTVAIATTLEYGQLLKSDADLVVEDYNHFAYWLGANAC